MKSKRFFLLMLALLLALALLPPARAEDAYTLTVEVFPAGAGAVTGAGSYEAGQVVALTATANQGYRFTGWQVITGGVTVADDGTFNMPAATVSITAKFEQQRTVIWLDGDGSELDRKTYWPEEGEPVTDKTPAKAPDATYRHIFAGWDNGVVEGAVKTYTPLFTDMPIYTVVKGAGAGYRLKSGKNHVISIKRTVDDDTVHQDVVRVKVGRTLFTEDTDYTVTKGSAVVTIKPSAMNKLSVGTNGVDITFRDGTVVSTTVKVSAAYDEHTGTGDNSHMFLWLGLTVVGMLGLAALYRQRRKLAQR